MHKLFPHKTSIIKAMICELLQVWFTKTWLKVLSKTRNWYDKCNTLYFQMLSMINCATLRILLTQNKMNSFNIIKLHNIKVDYLQVCTVNIDAIWKIVVYKHTCTHSPTHITHACECIQAEIGWRHIDADSSQSEQRRNMITA